MKQELREALSRLNAVLAAGDYERAQAVLGEVKAGAEALAAGGRLDEAVRDEVLSELERGRRLVLAARAHDAARLARLRKLPADYAASVTTGPAVRVDV